MEYTDTKVQPKKKYEYRVKAINPGGESEPSDQSEPVYAKPLKGQLRFHYLIQRTPFVRPPLLHQKSGLSRGVASRQGYKSMHLCLDLHCQVTFPKGLTVSGWLSG